MINLVKEYLKNCNEVVHTTFDPNGPGAIRIHLIPPKKPTPTKFWVVILNGQDVLPLNSSWAILLKEFINQVNQHDGSNLTEEDINVIVKDTAEEMKKVFPKTTKTMFSQDLKQIIITLKDIAKGKTPSEKIGYMTLAKYGKYMKAPHRMDLMISAMEKDSHWNCNQKCLHCYASGQILSKVEELSTEEWIKIINTLRSTGVSQITFTGGEPTIRKDLPQLVESAKWFVTRLNTNGVLLTKELCSALKEASLDTVQVTLYSHDEAKHNILVGSNHFNDTINGIKNAVEANINISINTPLCSLNKDYLETIKFASKLGVKYFSCSGLILTGNAQNAQSENTRLTKEEITDIIKECKKYMDENNLELSFTSPGWIDSDVLKKLKMVVPSCGAGLSNMAVAPNGEVIPCQSWLNDFTLGNLLTTKWSNIWNNKQTELIRKQSMKQEEVCPLSKKAKSGC